MLFSTLARAFSHLEETSSRLAMTQAIASLFSASNEEEIGEICYLLTGRVAPLYEALEFGIADKFMIRAIAEATGQTPDAVTTAFKKLGDLGSVAEALHPKHDHASQLTVHDVFTSLSDIAAMGGTGSQEQKIGAIAKLLSRADAVSARYIARIPLDKLRLGFSEMTILDALSWMVTGDKTLRPSLEDAYNVRPDIALIARKVKGEGVKGLSHMKAVVGAPILAALCQRLPNAAEMVRKMGKVDVEPKYDGVRTQIHVRRIDGGIRVSSFSRNLENTTAMYPELLSVGEEIDAQSVILDAEAVGYDATHDRLIPFQETVTRKRKHGVAEATESVPLRFFCFDILAKDAVDLMDRPLSERRKILRETVKGKRVLAVSPSIVTESADELRQYHDEQLKRGLEGVVVKKWDSPYEPGRKGMAWVKFKEEEGKTGKLSDTVDCVVMGYYRGKGKRAGFGIGAFLVGIRHGESYVTVTKIGTGVTDEQWVALKERFVKLETDDKPKEYAEVGKALVPDVWLAPSLVVEIAADDITVSPVHGAGYALRFPRLVRVREDKSPREATTSREFVTMYHNQESVKPTRG